MSRDAIDCAASLFAPRELNDHDRAAVVQSFREALPDPFGHTYRMRDVQDPHGWTMGFHHKVRVCKPDGTMDLLFIPRVQFTCFCDAEHVTPDGVMIDLSGNGCHLYPGPNGGCVAGDGKLPVANFAERGDFAKSLDALPSEPMHVFVPRGCK